MYFNDIQFENQQENQKNQTTLKYMLFIVEFNTSTYCHQL